MVFKTKKIFQTITLGEQLRKRRQDLNFSLEKMANRAGINKKYIEALETGTYSQLPGDGYSRNFLKTLAYFLDLPSERLLELYTQENNLYKKINGTSNKSSINQERYSKKNIVTPSLVKGLIIFLIIFSCLGYLGFKIQKIISPPILTISAPSDNLMVNEYLVVVAGQTEKEAKLTINDQEILINSKGYFKENIDLQEGLNPIKVTARKKHSRENIIYRNVIVIK